MTTGGTGSQGTAVVVGSGVIGTACAYFLMKSGWKVRIIDRGRLAGGSSHANCGYVCPSHVLPLAEPGMIAKAIQSLFQRNSPFKVKARFDPALWSWMLHFARRCNEKDMIAAGRGIQPLLNSSLALYREIIRDEGLDCEFQERGMLFVYRDAKELEAFAATDRIMGEFFDAAAQRLGPDEMLAMEPALKPGLAGGWYHHHDAHLRPDRLMKSWHAVLAAGGAELQSDCPLERLEGRNGRATAAQTPRGEQRADLFVIATGAWTPRLQTELGGKIPIQPGKGYSITMPRPSVCPSIPIIFPETRVAVTPFESGYRLGSTMEFAGYDESIRPERLRLLREGAAPYLREPYCDPVEEEWFGWRPMTYDSVPIIDRSPRFENVLIAAGHNMLGLSMAPATGKLVAELVNGTRPHIDPAPYRVSRFR
ncbi:MAG: NAD(P)/FAD-dependent oxidoreductase [Isosphaeraceae bacterium]